MTDKYETLRAAAKAVIAQGGNGWFDARQALFEETTGELDPDLSRVPDTDMRHIAAASPTAILALLDERDSLERMFGAACVDLGSINEALDLDPDDGGAEPILAAISDLLSEREALRDLLRETLAFTEANTFGGDDTMALIGKCRAALNRENT